MAAQYTLAYTMTDARLPDEFNQRVDILDTYFVTYITFQHGR